MAIFESARLHLFEKFIETAASRRQAEPAHLATGRHGELAAFFYLRRQGYIVVARGWRSGRLRGDIDLIAWHGETLCFIEVKTRDHPGRSHGRSSRRRRQAPHSSPPCPQLAS